MGRRGSVLIRKGMNMHRDDKELEQKIASMKVKINHVFNFLWFLLLTFLLVGSFLPAVKEKAVFGLVLLAMGWVSSEIMSRGIEATRALFLSENDSNNNKEQ